MFWRREDKRRVEEKIAELFLRGKDTPETRFGVVAGRRVAYMRGKDFIAHVQAKSDDIERLLHSNKSTSSSSSSSLTSAAGPAAKKSSAPLPTVVFQRFRALNMLMRVDRVLKVPPKGRKSLPKWPKKLEVHREQELIDSDTDAFYAWFYEPKPGLWETFGGPAFILVLPIFVCLYPLMPYRFKLYVAYVAMFLLTVIFGVVILRYMIFAFFWALTGYHVWVFPNLLRDEVPLQQIFSPRFEIVRSARHEDEKDSDGKELPKPPSIIARIVVMVLFVWFFYLCFTHAPDQEQQANIRKTVHNSMEEFLDWTNRASLSDGKNSTEDVQPENSCSGEGGGDGSCDSGLDLEEEDTIEPPNLDDLINEDLDDYPA